MTTFAIVTPCDSPHLPKVREAIARVFPDASMEFATGQFVATHPEMTSVQASQALAPSPNSGALGQFVVFTIAGQHGWHRRDLWEWLAVRGGS